MQAGESIDEGFRARLAKAPLQRRLAFTDGGLMLGAGAVVAKMTTDARGRPAGLALEGEEDAILARFAAAFGKAVSPHVIGNLSRASEHWSRGDKCLAHIHLAHAGLPAIDEAGALRLALCEEALALGCTPRAIYKALDLEPPPPFGKFNADQPRVSAGNGRESGRWTSGAGGADDVSGAAVREGRSVSPAASPGGVPAAASGTPKPGEPVPVVLNNGTVARDPKTGEPIVQPAGVSLAQNAKIGEALALLPTMFSVPPGLPTREAAMAALFVPGETMDYQRVYGVNGKINRDFIGFGNYNYGVVAAAAGYTREEALLAAGGANLLGSGKKDGPMFNNPKNIPFINQGYDDYKAGLVGRP